MKQYNLNKGYWQTPKQAEIELQKEIETALKEAGLDIAWWECLDNYPTINNIFMTYFEIYNNAQGLEADSEAFFEEFMMPYIDYYNEVVYAVNDYITKNKANESI